MNCQRTFCSTKIMGLKFAKRASLLFYSKMLYRFAPIIILLVFVLATDLFHSTWHWKKQTQRNVLHRESKHCIKIYKFNCTLKIVTAMCLFAITIKSVTGNTSCIELIVAFNVARYISCRLYTIYKVQEIVAADYRLWNHTFLWKNHYRLWKSIQVMDMWNKIFFIW